MITVAELRTRTVKDLATMAKRKKVSGWHAMRKDDLVKALSKVARAEAAKLARKGKLAAKGNSANGKGSSANGKGSSANAKGSSANAKGSSANGKGSSANGKGSTSGGKKSSQGSSKSAKAGNRSRQTRAAKKSGTRRSAKCLSQVKATLTRSKDLTHQAEGNGQGHGKDRLILMVRDPYWLHAYWELTRQSIDRARVAMGQEWHVARAVLRLAEVLHEGSTHNSRKLIRDIEIHGGVNNWYVDVEDPPKSYQLDIGYLASGGKFLCLARSNVVTTPQTGSLDTFDGNWAEVAEDFDRIYALSGGYAHKSGSSDLKELFEERLRRPMGSPMVTRFGMGAQAAGRGRPEFPFEVDADLIVYGMTDPGAHVTLKGEPIRIQPDGSFTVRFTLGNRRQVLPVVASSVDGVQQQTIVLAVERNTKVMEPVIREPDA